MLLFGKKKKEEKKVRTKGISKKYKLLGCGMIYVDTQSAKLNS